MAFRASPTSRLALELAGKAVVIGALTFAAAYTAVLHDLYALGLVLTVTAALVALSLSVAIRRADMELKRFVEDMAAEVFDRPRAEFAAFPSMSGAMEAAGRRVRERRLQRERELELFRSLTDSVAAALFVVHADGTLAFTNSAARELAGEPVERMEDVVRIGPDTSRRLLAMTPGAREIVGLTDGRQMLAATTQFATPGASAQRLIALQDVASDLGAVEVKAWQDLVRILGHEILNSLTPISSMADSIHRLLSRTQASAEDLPHVLREVSAAAEVIFRRSVGLMDFVNHYRRVGELPQPILESFSVWEFVKGIDLLMADRVKAAGITYESHVRPAALELTADPKLLEQVVINLLSNAIDAVRQHAQPKVTFACDERDGLVVLAVEDNGIGVADSVRDKLFLPFFTTKPGGSGVGLSIARQVALAHQAKIEVEDRVGGGAIFRLSLPAPAGSVG